MQFQIKSAVVRVNVADRQALFAKVKERLGQERGFALATINLDHLVKLRQSPAFLAAYQQQDFVVADGNPIVWLSRLAARPVSLVPGSELVVPLAKIAAEAQIPIALLGSTEATLAQAAEGLRAAVPKLEIRAQIAPPFGFDPASPEADALLRQIAESGAGLCFLALGAPKQEILAARGRQIAPDVGFVSIGAGLDFIAGTQTRAPRWVRRLALEWLWRLLSSPRRLFMRYAQCVGILPALVLAAKRLARRG